MLRSLLRRTARPAPLVMAVLAALASAPAPAAAQTDLCDVEPISCDATPPEVVVSAQAWSLSGAEAERDFVVTVEICERAGGSGLDAASKLVVVDGDTLPASEFALRNGTRSGCFVFRTATDTVALAAGQHTIAAAATDLSGNQGWGSGTLTYTVTGSGGAGVLDVTPNAGTAAAAAGARSAQRFTVRNTGQRAATFTVGADCAAAGALAECTASLARLTLAGGDSAAVAVSFRAAPTVGTQAWARLWARRADAPAITDTGAVRVTAVAPAAAGRAGDPGDGTSVERSLCLTVSVAPSAAYECGDLRIAHGLPGVRLRNRARAPTLVYNSQHARPYPVVSVNHTPAGTAPDTVVAVLRVSVAPDSTAVYRSSFPGWAAGTAKRVAVGFDATGFLTSAYDYVLEIFHRNAGEKGTLVASHPGTLVVVNRRFGQFGAGWWVAGVEVLMTVRGQHLLWVGGDGSTRLYQRASASDTVWWVRSPVDRPDTLHTRSDGRAVRRLPGGTEVWFDAGGRHERTVNAIGQTTRFVWSASGFLEKIVLPDPAYEYRFEFNNTYSRLSRVVSPGPDSVRSTRVLTDASGRVERITDPSGDSVRFAYRDATARIHTRTDRRGTLARFWFDPGSRLTTVQLPHPVAGQTATSHFIAQETIALRSILGPRDTAQVFTVHNGFRDDASAVDHSYFWLDRWGAPVQVQDALLNRTQVTRGDPRFPALVTGVRHANGRELSASYDARGNLAASTDWSTVATHGRAAATTYRWDPKWDAVTETTLPEGEVTRTGLDAHGRPAWVQPGSDPARRTSFEYLPLSHPTAPGQLFRVKPPLSGAEVYGYDGRGNLASVTDAAGNATYTHADRIGRDTLVVPPAGARVRTRYDAADRAARTVSFRAPPGSAPSSTLSDSLVVATTYDAEGAPRTVSRTMFPSPTNIGTTEYRYDALGRRVAEEESGLGVDSLVYDAAGLVVENHTRYHSPLTGRQVITFRHDALGRLTERVVPAFSVALGPESLTKFGRTWSFPTYPLDPNQPDAPLRIAADTAAFAYDAMGNLTAAGNGAGLVRRAWAANGALLSETQKLFPYLGRDSTRHVYTVSYRHDLNGRRVAVRQPVPAGPDSVVYRYDSLTGALAEVRDLAGGVFTFRHDAEGRLERADGPGGFQERLGYDVKGRVGTFNGDSLFYDPLDRVREVAYTGSHARQVEAEYGPFGALTFWRTRPPAGYEDREVRVDALGNPVREVWDDLSAVQEPPPGAEEQALIGSGRGYREHVYSPFGQLTETLTRADSADAWAAATSQALSWYDNAGNRMELRSSSSLGEGRTLQEHTRSYYRADGRLVAVDRQRCRTQLHYTGTGGAGTSTPLCVAWDPVAGHDPAVFEEYRYDALGRRVLVRARPSSECAPQHCPATMDRFVWDGDQILQEIRAGAVPESDDPSGVSFGRVAYTHAGGIDHPVSVVRFGLSAGTASIVPRWSWRGLVSGAAYADGATSNGAGGIDLATIRFPGQNTTHTLDERTPYSSPKWIGSLVMDQRDGSGQLYRRNRYYDPATGRFTQADPNGIAGGLNLYGFGGGDAVNYSDPFGLCPYDQPGQKKRTTNVSDCTGRMAAIFHAISKYGGRTGRRIIEHVAQTGTRFQLASTQEQFDNVSRMFGLFPGGRGFSTNNKVYMLDMGLGANVYLTVHEVGHLILGKGMRAYGYEEPLVTEWGLTVYGNLPVDAQTDWSTSSQLGSYRKNPTRFIENSRLTACHNQERATGVSC